ncbi:MAG: class I SAM-dependent methyltransferase [Leptolyngbyaceae cyanobacterium]
MQRNNLKNILAQARKPNRFAVMSKKVFKRLFDYSGKHTQQENLTWLQRSCSSFEDLAYQLDAELWKEAQQNAKELEQHAAIVLESVEFDLGGGGGYPILYFITRYLQPTTIVETGVAAGFSSYALLSAIDVNRKGSLYSSDFPYFRLPEPERYIGFVVKESLKKFWNLYLEGDEINLPRILQKVNEIDLFHYDSDKSYSGREFAIATLKPHMSDTGIVLMDDIQDNSYFYDYVDRENPKSWYVFEYQGKYIGMLGALDKLNEE